MNPRHWGLTLAAVWLASAPAFADEAGESGAWRVRTLMSTHRFIPDEPRADPDQPALRYALHGGRWKAAAGGSVLLVALETDTLRVGLSLAGFLELLNINEADPVPWQSFRANIGANMVAESPRLSRAWLPSGGRMYLDVGWFHESDHAAALSAYTSEYLEPRAFGGFAPWFDNANFSAYEYIKLRAAYRQSLWGDRLRTFVALGARLFPEPINSNSLRELRSAFLVEARVSFRIRSSVRAFVSLYDEFLDNDFVAQQHGFRFGLDRTPLRYAIVNVGVDWVGASGTIMSPFVAYSNSHGRGIDFPRFYGSEFGFGVSWLL